jgi:hypothetical protein
MPVTKPTSVSADGKPLAFSNKGGLQPGQWSYDAHLGCVTVKLQFGAKPAALSIADVQRKELIANQGEWIFDAAGDPQGWSAAHDLSQPVVADGAVKMSITGGDPYFISPMIAVPAEKVSGIAVRVRASKPDGRFFWANNNGGFAPAREVGISFPADGQFHDVAVDLTAHPEWTGTIRQVRVDFNGNVGDTGELQWVRVVKK